MDMHHLLFAGDTMQHDADRDLIHSTESMEISPVKMQVMFAFIAYVQWQFIWKFCMLGLHVNVRTVF